MASVLTMNKDNFGRTSHITIICFFAIFLSWWRHPRVQESDDSVQSYSLFTKDKLLFASEAVVR